MYNPSVWGPTDGLATEPWIHLLNSPPNNSFILSQPANYSTEGLNWEPFTNDFPSLPAPSMTNPCDLYDNAPVSAPCVQTTQPNPHSQLLNTPLSAQGVALGPIAKHHQTPNSPLSSLTSSSRSQARSQASSHGVDVTSEQVLHACHIAGCSEGLIKQAKQNHEPGLLTIILNYQVIEEVLTSVGQCNLEESERFLGVFDWNSLNSEVHSERLLEAFGWNVHSFKHKRRWYS